MPRITSGSGACGLMISLNVLARRLASRGGCRRGTEDPPLLRRRLHIINSDDRRRASMAARAMGMVKLPGWMKWYILPSDRDRDVKLNCLMTTASPHHLAGASAGERVRQDALVTNTFCCQRIMLSASSPAIGRDRAAARLLSLAACRSSPARRHYTQSRALRVEPGLPIVQSTWRRPALECSCSKTTACSRVWPSVDSHTPGLASVQRHSRPYVCSLAACAVSSVG